MLAPMNKWITVCLVILLTNCATAWGQSSGASGRLYGSTRLDVGTLHAGSYRKERPIIFLEQEFNYRLGERFSVGLGTGIDLYPGALAFPVFLSGTYAFPVGQQQASVQTSLGANLRIAELFFFSYRNVSSLGWVLGRERKVQWVPRLGYVMNLDRYWGGSLSALFGLDIRYGLN